MAYTILLSRLDEAHEVRTVLEARIMKDGRFTATLSSIDHKHGGRRSKEGWFFTLQHVRLTKPKLYCGQHPGECLINPYFGPQKKLKGKWLEWDDWVQLHDLVNDVIDEMKYSADVWTNPREDLDQGSKMWVRRDNKRRVRWDYEERVVPNHWAPRRIWNTGSPDQFAS